MNYSTTLTQWTALQNLLVPFYGETASLSSEHPNATLQYSCSRRMAQTALFRASTCFTFTPLINNRKAAPFRESTSAWCVAECSGSQPTWCLGAAAGAHVAKNELPVHPNLPGSMSHQCLGCQQPGRRQIAEQLCMHDVTEDTLSLHRFQIRFWLQWEATFRLIILLPPSYQKSQHCHKSREVWRAENTQNCREEEWVAQHHSVWAAH